MVRALYLALAMTVAATPSAKAQTDDERAQARAAFQRGVEAYGAERYEDALRSFQEAYRVAPHPSVRVNMANCYERLDRPIEALGHFERFLVEAESASPSQQQEVRAAVRRLRRQVGEVFLRVQPEGAMVQIDGVLTRTAPVLEAVELARGTHRVEVSMAGFAATSRSFEVRGGDRVELNVTLEESAAGTRLTSPVTSPAPDALQNEERDADDVDDEGPGEEAERDEDARRGRSLHFGTSTTVAGAATVGLLGAAIGVGVAALGAESDFEDAVTAASTAPTAAERNAARANGRDADRRASRLSIATDVLAVGALLAAGATVFFLLWGGDDDDTVTTQVAPLAGPNAGGLIVQRSF